VASTGDFPPAPLSDPTSLRMICMVSIDAPDGEKLRAPCCRRVGGSDGNTELTDLSTASAGPLQPCQKILDTPLEMIWTRRWVRMSAHASKIAATP